MAGGFNPVLAGVGDNKIDVYGATEVGIWTVAFTSTDTYTTGGWAPTAAQFGLSRPILAILVIAQNTAGAGIEWTWNSQTSKLQGFVTGTAANAVLNELGSASTLIQSVTLTVLVITQR